MPKVFDLEWDRLEEYRLQAADLDDEEPDEDTMMEFLAYMNERTGAGGARRREARATVFGLAMTTKEKAVSGAGTLETAQSEENMACSLPSENITKRR